MRLAVHPRGGRQHDDGRVPFLDRPVERAYRVVSLKVVPHPSLRAATLLKNPSRRYRNQRSDRRAGHAPGLGR
jgi:hypothetical protein